MTRTGSSTTGTDAATTGTASSALRDAADTTVMVRAASGEARDDGWARRRQLPRRQRLIEASRFAAIGVAGGALLLFVPLIHLVGVVFALALLGIAALRLWHADVLIAAGGICPRCGETGAFFVGLGRRRFQLPASASCGACGVDLTLEARPSERRGSC